MNISPWIQAARLKTLVASVIPIFSAMAILPALNQINIYILLLTIFAALTIQIATNYINDLYDFLKGADKNRVGPKRMLQSRLITEIQMKKAILSIVILGLFSGIPLAMKGGWIIVIIGLSSFLFAYLYTAGPFALAYHGLGDIFVFLYFGLIAVSGSYYLQTNTINMSCLYLGFSIGCKNILLLIINNLRDYKNDKKVNKKTLIVKLGFTGGKIYGLIIIVMSYVGILLLSFSSHNHSLLYLMILSFPLAINIAFDIFFKHAAELNPTLAKVSALLTLDLILLFTSRIL
ncbi:MAG: 1,4-dihydroxy-2-naphthoate octaprenyltransferase [Candidatus Marinimicrobia bacterium]|nr:1,4-dihydroxy-2-naphthoate octaprenyltransferase [Candidatus Neomarinimicrobiota bacterium]|tara:strand:+ start:20596 stop:21465 length:870 start_codon:yes stop_codon:yes gene_type:complete